MWWIKRQKRADEGLQELADGLTKSLGSKIMSVLLFGSKASGEYREGSSDVNVFIVLDDLSAETLELLRNPVRAWVKGGHVPPVLATQSELSLFAKSLPIEFLDMQDHHRVIYGNDPLQGLVVDRLHLRAQVEQELATKQIKLRQAMVLAGADPKKVRPILVESLPSVLTLYRAALRLESDVPKGDKIAAAKALADRAGLNSDCLQRLASNHIRRESDNVLDVADHYLQSIDQLIRYVGRK